MKNGNNGLNKKKYHSNFNNLIKIEVININQDINQPQKDLEIKKDNSCPNLKIYNKRLKMIKKEKLKKKEEESHNKKNNNN